MANLFRRFLNLFRRKNAQTDAFEATDSLAGKSADNPTDLSNRSTATPNSSSSLPAVAVTTQPSSDPRIENLKQVVNVLRAYSVTFGQPENELELRAVVGAIAAIVATVQIENSKLEPFIDEAIAAYNSLGTDASLVDVGAQLLAEKASVWLAEQENAVSNIMSAYLQQFAPEDADWQTSDIVGLAQIIIATLNDGSLSRSGGKELVKRVVNSFDIERALSQWVAPEWIALAQRVASYAEKGDLQAELQSIAWAYVQQFQSILSPQLIEQIMQEGPMNVSAAEFLSGDLGDFSRMLYYKFQLLEAEPIVNKTHEQIVADVHSAVEVYRERNKVNTDLTTGVQDGNLSVGSPFLN